VSRIKCRVGKYVIVAGYDQPLDDYFASVQDSLDDTDEDGEDKYVYASLDDPEAGPGGGFPYWQLVCDKVEAVVCQLPREFWEQVQVKRGNYEQDLGVLLHGELCPLLASIDDWFCVESPSGEPVLFSINDDHDPADCPAAALLAKAGR